MSEEEIKINTSDSEPDEGSFVRKPSNYWINNIFENISIT